MKRSIALLCVLIMTLGLLAGCGASEQATAGSLVEEAENKHERGKPEGSWRFYGYEYGPRYGLSEGTYGKSYDR